MLVVLAASCDARTADESDRLHALLIAADARPLARDSLTPIVDALGAEETELRVQAVRALGRLERPELVPVIAPVLQDADARVRAEAANALAQSVIRQPPGDVRMILGNALSVEQDASVRGVLATSLGRLRVDAAADAADGAVALAQAYENAAADARIGFAKGWHHLARQPASRDALASAAEAMRTLITDAAGEDLEARRTRTLVVAAMLAAGSATSTDLDGWASDEHAGVRREVAAGVAATGDTAAGRRLLPALLRDADAAVRLEAVRAWGRLGLALPDCAPLDHAATDSVPHVALMAIDLLPACGGDAARTARLDSLAAALPAGADDAWHVAAHALVSLARIDAVRARPHLPHFAAHASPFVRAWAARAAGDTRDREILEGLAVDSAAIVRTASLRALAALDPRGADDLAIQALESDDGELLIAASEVLEGTSDTAAHTALLNALERLGSQQRETARDPRSALLTRIEALGTPADTAALLPLLADYDAVIAQHAARVLEARTGSPRTPTPTPLPRVDVPTPAALDSLQDVTAVIEMQDGGIVALELRPWDAPTNTARFVRLVREGWFDGLTFHRVAPNFVVQGGSPRANEFAGDAAYTRDELGIEGNWRGTVGISTRGRDTGDGQIYFNLIDNIRLDHDYTVFAEVIEGMDVVDRMLEGARIRRISLR